MSCILQVVEDVAGYEFRAVVSAREVFVAVAVDEVITAVYLCELSNNFVFVSADVISLYAKRYSLDSL